MNIKRLCRAVRISKNYEHFERRVIQFIKWYDIPITWTKKDIKDFYRLHGGTV